MRRAQLIEPFRAIRKRPTRRGGRAGVLAFRPVVVAATLALALGLPVVLSSVADKSGFIADDWWQLDALRGEGFAGGPTEGKLFRFGSGDSSDLRQAQQAGVVPWHADPGIRSEFLRPVSGWLHHLDGWLFGESAAGAKLHSLGWYLLLVVIASRLLRDLVARQKISMLASALFAMSGLHWQLVGWVAARNALVAATLAMLSLVLYLRWRRERWKPGAFLSPLALLAGLLAGEVAVTALGYFVAYELCSGGKAHERLRALAPIALVTLGWLMCWVTLGYGVEGSGMYIDPSREPLALLTALPNRLLAALGITYLGFPADLWFARPDLRPLAMLCAPLAAVLLWLPLRRLIREQPSHRRYLAWFGLGSCLSIVPALAGFLGPRSFVLPSLGAAALIATALVAGSDALREKSANRPLAMRLSVIALGSIHILGAIGTWFATTAFYEGVHRATNLAMRTLPVEARSDETWVVINAPDVFFERYLPSQRRHAGLPMPGAYMTLSMSECDHQLRRADESTLELVYVDSHVMESPYNAFTRDPVSPLVEGDTFDIGAMVATVLETGPEGATRVALRLDEPLDDPSIKFFVFREGRFERIEPPGPGQTIHVPFSPNPVYRGIGAASDQQGAAASVRMTDVGAAAVRI